MSQPAPLSPTHASPALLRCDGPLAACLMWLAWVAGSLLARWSDGSATRVIDWHVALGSAVLLCALTRACLRATKRPAHQRDDTRATLWHQLLRAGLASLWLLAPASGWLALNAAGRSALLLGIVPLPRLFGIDPALQEVFDSLHAGLSWALGALLTLRALSAVIDAARQSRGRRPGTLPASASLS